MSLSTIQIAWIAGLLEGEGCFGLTNSKKCPSITLQMTDRDVVEKAKEILDPSRVTTIGEDQRKETYKPYFRITVNGHKAVGWMMTLYSFMSERRKTRIKECLEAWKSSTIDSRYSRMMNNPATRKSFQRTIALRKLGYSEDKINLAHSMAKVGLSEETILAQLEALI